MAYYIFNTDLEAEAYNDACVTAHGHSGSTQRWAGVQKHPTLDKWAIQSSDAVDVPAVKVDSLPADWVEEIIF